MQFSKDNMRFFIIAIFALVTFVPFASAQTPTSGSNASETVRSGVNTSETVRSGVNTPVAAENVTLINPLKGDGTLEGFLMGILNLFIRLGTIVVILMLVYVGFLFVVAQGEPGKISEAREALLWTVIGALVLLGSKAIALGIEATVQALSVGG